jgi:hypothetical protein
MRRIIVVILILALLLPLARAQANSAPPPGEVWFFIDLQNGDRLQGAQLWGCEDPACAQPAVLRQWGECTAPGCLPAPPPHPDPLRNHLECAGDVCRAAGYEFPQPYFRLALQAGGRLYTDPAARELPDAYGETFYWNVSVAPGGLAFSPAQGLPRSELPAPPFLAFFGLTLLVEMLVVGVFARWRWKLDLPGVIVRMLIAGVINLLTYPVVWGFFPAFLRFGSPGMRSFGWLLTGSLLAVGLLLALAINARSRRMRLVWIVAGLLVAVFGSGCVFVGLWGAAYGSLFEALTGLPGWLVLLLAEAYAVVVEALMLFAFTRREVDLRLAFLLSLGMNVASFLAGLLLNLLT